MSQDGWTIEDSLELYLCSHRQLQGVDPKDWARRVRQQRLNQDHLELFSANAKGELEVLLSDYLNPPKNVSVQAILEQTKEPIAMLRFPELLERQMNRLNLAFAGAIQRHVIDTNEGAPGFIKYQGIYPLKVNQRKEVVETIVRYETLSRFPIPDKQIEGSPLASHPELLALAKQDGPGLVHTAPVWGLEVGSRPELVIALAYLRRQKEALGKNQQVWEDSHVVICNGGKDPLYHRIAITAMDMGLNVTIVVDSPQELASILNEAKEVWPNGDYSLLQLGVRIKTLTVGSGKWETSGGKGSKFGLCGVELIEFLDLLRKHKLNENLKMVHFHIGSQIVEWENITDSMAETAQLYFELRAGDFPKLSRVDVGGGLAINYEEHLVKDQSSALYDHNDYADMIVRTFMRNLQQVARGSGYEKYGPITISTESGRFITAPYAVLAARVLDARPYDYPAPPDWGTEGGERGIAEVWKSVFPSQLYAFSDIDAIPQGASAETERGDGAGSRARRPALDSALWHLHRLLRQFTVFAPGAPGPDGATAYFKDENRGFFDLSYLEVLADAIGEAEKYVNRIGKYSLVRLADRVEYERLVSAFDRLVTTAFRHFCEQQQEVMGPNAFPYHPFKPSRRYIVNFSTFGQLIDIQLVNQYFPALPLSQLHRKPDYLASLGDLTCDSDGEIKHFVSYVDRNWGCSPQELSPAQSVAKCFAAKDSKVMAVPGERLDLTGMPVHDCDPIKDNYYIGWLFVGAYQDVLRTKHNLFGKPHSIIVSTRSRPGLATRPVDGRLTGFHTRRQAGESVGIVVREMDYDEADLRHEVEMIFEDHDDLVDRMFNTLPYLNPVMPANPLGYSGSGSQQS